MLPDRRRTARHCKIRRAFPALDSAIRHGKVASPELPPVLCLLKRPAPPVCLAVYFPAYSQSQIVYGRHSKRIIYPSVKVH